MSDIVTDLRDLRKVEKCLRDTDKWNDVQVVGIETVESENGVE